MVFIRQFDDLDSIGERKQVNFPFVGTIKDSFDVLIGDSDTRSELASNYIEKNSDNTFIKWDDSYAIITINGKKIIGWYENNILTSQNTAITDCVIGKEITTIGNGAFMDCVNLTSVTIPESVTSIGMGGFANCIKLENLTIPDSVTSLGTACFSNCNSLANIVLPESLTTIGNSAFTNCTSLNNVIIPSNITSIPNALFNGCSSLDNITIPDNVTSIGISAFTNCTSLSNVLTPTGISSISDACYYGCENLTDITLPEQIKEIGKYSFSNCRNLETIESLNAGNMDISAHAFDNCYYLETIDMSNCSTLNIGDYAFSGCSNLVNVIQPTAIGMYGISAFENCESLQSFTIPRQNSATYTISLGSNIFRNCRNLMSISMGNSVPEIPSGAFSGCTNLQYIDFSGYVTGSNIPEVLDTTAFDGVENCYIVVPTNRYDEWTKAWANAWDTSVSRTIFFITTDEYNSNSH